MNTTCKSKTLATWIAVIGGGFGLHRFYLHGKRDMWGWLWPIPTALGLWGVMRAKQFGQDDQLSWLLIPLGGFALAAAMLAAIVYGLMPDERWNARFNPQGPEQRSGWPAIFGVATALFAGAIVLMSTIAFSGQRYFEYEAGQAQTKNEKLSQ